MPRQESTKIDAIRVWAIVYLIVVVIASMLKIEYSLFVFGALLIFALPFVKCPEYYLGITVLLQTISYYFVGADEGLIGLNTILVILYAANLLLHKGGKIRINHRNMVSLILLIAISIISYSQSPFQYTNGLYRFIYLIAVSIFIGNIVEIDFKRLFSILAPLTTTLACCYGFTLLFSSALIDGRLTIDSSVNTNTFGMSCAQLGTILFLTYYITNRKVTFLFSSLFVVVLALLSGSRGAILAGIAACGLTILLYEKNRRNLSKTITKWGLFAVIISIVLSVLAPVSSFDYSRFSFEEMFSSTGSGTSRLLIITSIIPYIIDNRYYIWGYGPGHECSRRVIKSLITWNYSHTHNTILESFAELGIGGLICTISSIYYSIKNVVKTMKVDKRIYILFGMLACLLVNGMAESYFCDSFFWLILAVTRNHGLSRTKN